MNRRRKRQFLGLVHLHPLVVQMHHQILRPLLGLVDALYQYPLRLQILEHLRQKLLPVTHRHPNYLFFTYLYGGWVGPCGRAGRQRIRARSRFRVRRQAVTCLRRKEFLCPSRI